MASLVLSLAGASLGSALLGPVGAVGGRLVGALAGSLIDRSLFASQGGNTDRAYSRSVNGPRLQNLGVQSSTEGAAIPRLYGRARLSGQMIWATNLEEEVSVSTSTTASTTSSSSSGGGGGKGFGGGGASSTSTTSVTTTTTTYSYFANVAIGLCEGPVAHLGRIWADGKPLALDGITFRFYHGDESQQPDALIVAKEGAANAPAYRGLCYIVFERLPLADFGNRIPQLSFELVRPVGQLETMVRALCVIPGTTEFGYDPRVLIKQGGSGRAAQENRHTSFAQADFAVAIDEAQALCPNLRRVSLVAGWFGTDLRAGSCQVMPKVDLAAKEVSGTQWQVSALTRDTASVVSLHDGRPAYGGSPSDESLILAIRDLKQRGLAVTLNPFVMMDIPQGNSLPDPHNPASAQPAYPWRGRITCHPAPGVAGSPDGTSGAATQVSAFFGSAQPGHFAVSGNSVTYSGPNEWSYRRMVLHMAALAQAAGGVDAFLIGSELIGLTRVRSGSGVYPAVAQLRQLAADVKAILPGAKLVYAADWTEYGAHVRGNEVRFPLDSLFADPNIAAVGIDFYAPLSDWREGAAHADALLAASPQDVAYLRSRVFAGEAFDFYYASDEDRLNGIRTPITDGLGKPWIHRQKDLRSWWANSHVERVSGAETSATAWVPGMKPLWLNEIGVPAVDKGANQPSTFPDPKSSESGLPYFSTGQRDDLIQRRALQALLSAFDPDFGASESENPVSSVYGGRMIDPGASAIWAYDARPWPAFPLAGDVWGDADNWTTGHWLNGRLGTAPLADLIAAVLADYGLSEVSAASAPGLVDGLVLDRPMTARAVLDDLCGLFAVEAREEEGRLTFFARPNRPAALLSRDLCVEEEGKALTTTRRVQDSELPLELTVSFSEGETDYRSTAVSSRRQVGATRQSRSLDLGVTASRALLQAETDNMLQDIWAGRDTVSCHVPPSLLALQPGDAVTLSDNGLARTLLVTALNGGLTRALEARVLPASRTQPAFGTQRRRYKAPAAIGSPAVMLIELPAPAGGETALLRAAASLSPWPGPLGLWRGSAATGFAEAGVLPVAATMGETLQPLAAGPLWRFDHATTLDVQLISGALASLPPESVLGGNNALALANGQGGHEIIQFANAALIGPGTYRLSGLLRGAGGSEAAMADTVPASAAFALLDASLVALASGSDWIGREATWRIGARRLGPADGAAVQITATVEGLALKPLAPVHLNASREGSDIRLTWIRRTRTGGDNWDLVEVPLAEESEAYRLTLYGSGGTVMARYDSPTPSFLYTRAQQTADFGSLPSSLTFTVCQLSALVGEGFAATGTFAL